MYDFFYYFPGLYRYSEQMDLDWLGAGEERARDKFWDEMEYWEKQGFPKDDVELEIEGTLSELKEQGILTED